MKTRYRLIRRGSRGGAFYCVDTHTGKRSSLQTSDENDATQIIEAKNNAVRQPTMNLQIAQVYLRHGDPAVATRTWQYVMQQIISTKTGNTRERWKYAIQDAAFDFIRDRKLVETTAEHFIEVLKRGSVSTNMYLRRAHNFAMGMHWLPWPVLPKLHWPPVHYKEKRAITAAEHQKIIDRERNQATRAFYQLLWHLGGSQTDIATLTAEDIDWRAHTISYHARDNPGHWREVLTLAARHAGPDRGVPAADALVYSQFLDGWLRGNSPRKADWRAAVLAAEQLLEIGLAAVDSEVHHRAVRDRVASWLAGLLEHGALPVKDRARAGIVLGKLGDPRKGVGLKNGLPDIDWIKIPAGKFKVGGKESGRGGPGLDCALINQPYRIGRDPITVAQYRAFVGDKGYEQERFWNWSKAAIKWRAENKPAGPEDYDPVFQTPNHPRVGVSWFEAVAFCQWLTERLKAFSENGTRSEEPPSTGKDGASLTRLLPGERICLPSEAEWERAARGEHGRPYPWGDATKFAERCNCGETGIGQTSAAGLFPSGDARPLEPGNETGVADMTGNVWEWCRTPWLSDYKKYEQNVSEDLEGDIPRVLRGGSWRDGGPDALHTSCRYVSTPAYRDSIFGFRCVLVGQSVR